MRIALASAGPDQCIAVPGDGPAQAFLEAHARLPAEHALGLGGVEPLAIDLARGRPFPEYIGDQIRTSRELQDEPDEVEHTHGRAVPRVERLAPGVFDALGEQQVELDRIVDVDIVALG